MTGAMTIDQQRFADLLGAMDDEMRRAPEIVQPSKFWAELNRRHLERSASSGVANFKRTFAKDYFTWMRVLPWDSQIRFLVRSLSPLDTLRAVVNVANPRRHEHIPVAEGLALNFLTRLIWRYAAREAPEEVFQLREPTVGNPPDIRVGGRLVSQDLANAILEFRAFRDVATGTICELGGGYGRTAFVSAALRPGNRHILVDIPPALGVTQAYLSTVFPKRRHFAFRPFDRFEDVRAEFERADFAYLLPHQLSLLPAGSVDLFVNISSLHEMRRDQIDHYLTEIFRLVRPGGHFYLKAWKVSRLPLENIVTREDDYPLSGWERVWRRTAPVQTRFFETLLRHP